ncbi:MAG TPA: DUF4158 domain-containing protein, partial [Blastocatellia bacterium]|nr:DUF4158 domain-containing protein [Blastocatellia bacterium]
MPTPDEIDLAHSLSQSTALRIGFLLLLKTSQRLSYFLPLLKVPRPIAEHVSLLYGVHYGAMDWPAYDASGSRYRHTARIREHLGVGSFDESARRILSEAVQKAARLREDIADIVNIAIEELVRQRYELPGFRTLRDEAQRARAAVNREYGDRVSHFLGKKRRDLIDQLLDIEPRSRKSLWHTLKLDPGASTLKQVRAWNERLNWLRSLDLHTPQFFFGIPVTRLQSFVREAQSLNAARMKEIEPHKRYLLAAVLVRRQIAQCLDDIGEMLIKRIRRMHHHAHTEYQQALLRRQSQTDYLLTTFYQLLLLWMEAPTAEDKLVAL